MADDATARTSHRILIAGTTAWAGLLIAVRDILAIAPSPRGTSHLEAFLFNTEATLPALHVALATGVLFHRRRDLQEAIGRSPQLLLGGATSSLGLALLAWARSSGQIDLQIDALLLLAAGTALAAGGFRLLEKALIPLAILALARPWPPMLAHHAHERLQTLTGDLASTILSLFAAPTRAGHLISFDGRLFEVVEGCSGLKIEVSLLTAILVYAAFLSRSRRQTLGLAMIALALGPLLNVARVMAIMVDASTEIGKAHTTQGLIAISFGVVVIAVLDRWLEGWLWPEPSAGGVSPQPRDIHDTYEGRRRAAGLIICGMVVSSAIALGALPKNDALSVDKEGWALHEIRPQLGPWRRVGSRKLDTKFLGTVKFADKLFWEYERENGGHALVFVGVDNRRRRDYSGFTPKTRTLGATWEVETMEQVRIEDLDVEAERVVLVGNEGERWWAFHYRIAERSLLEESLRWLAAADLWPDSPPIDLVSVRIAVRAEGQTAPRTRFLLEELQREVGRALKRAAPPATRERLGWSIQVNDAEAH